jgi:signal peptidase I
VSKLTLHSTSIAIGLLAALVTLGATCRLVLVVVTVVGPSMVPSLQDGDRVLVLRTWTSSLIRRGQIVLVRGRGGVPGRDPLMVKRVLGLPGDVIVTHLDELPEHARPAHQRYYDPNGRRVWHITEDHVFLRSDGRGVDSRLWGPVNTGELAGVVIATLSRGDTP